MRNNRSPSLSIGEVRFIENIFILFFRLIKIIVEAGKAYLRDRGYEIKMGSGVSEVLFGRTPTGPVNKPGIGQNN